MLDVSESRRRDNGSIMTCFIRVTVVVLIVFLSELSG